MLPTLPLSNLSSERVIRRPWEILAESWEAPPPLPPLHTHISNWCLCPLVHYVELDAVFFKMLRRFFCRDRGRLDVVGVDAGSNALWPVRPPSLGDSGDIGAHYLAYVRTITIPTRSSLPGRYTTRRKSHPDSSSLPETITATDHEMSLNRLSLT